MEKKHIKILMKLVAKAYRNDEVPIAAIIIYKNRIIAKAYNKRNESNFTISHAEIEAINKANVKMKSWRLNKCSMYVTVRPCEMCEKVIKEARLEKVYYLVERESYKKQYDKTEFIKYLDPIHDDIIKKYKIKLNSFWKNKR